LTLAILALLPHEQSAGPERRTADQCSLVPVSKSSLTISAVAAE
jgi:hypothetical protein